MLIIAETKPDESFSDAQFRVNNYHLSFYGETTEIYTEVAWDQIKKKSASFSDGNSSESIDPTTVI